jgi:hypothetical protein
MSVFLNGRLDDSHALFDLTLTPTKGSRLKPLFHSSNLEEALHSLVHLQTDGESFKYDSQEFISKGPVPCKGHCGLVKIDHVFAISGKQRPFIRTTLKCVVPGCPAHYEYRVYSRAGEKKGGHDRPGLLLVQENTVLECLS